MNVQLRLPRDDELEGLWHLIFDDPAWKQWDAPYWPLVTPPLPEWRERARQQRREGSGPWRQYIDVDGELAGMVSANWEDEASGWVEAGIVLYRATRWGQGLGRRALLLWLEQLFGDERVYRVSLTTWNGNERLMRLALGLGFLEEARLREARLWQGRRWDSMRYGLLRREWEGHRSDLQATDLQP